jgi:hypothetical protein
MPNDLLVQSVRCHLPDDAHVQMFDGGLATLATDNPLRAQHFAVTIRELFGHVLSSKAPDDAVQRCAWYKREEGTSGPTRRQRALYQSRGGLSDDFIRDTLKLDPDEFHRGLGKAFDELSKYTHFRPNTTIPTEPDQIEEFANRALTGFGEVFDVIDDVRDEIVQAIEPHLQDEAASVFIGETIEKLDIMAGRYTTEGVLFDETSVLEIGAEFIRYRVTGTVDVQLQYGGKSDPAEIDETFPFTCTIAGSVSEPFKFLSDMTEMEVDTSSWYGEDLREASS